MFVMWRAIKIDSSFNCQQVCRVIERELILPAKQNGIDLKDRILYLEIKEPKDYIEPEIPKITES